MLGFELQSDRTHDETPQTGSLGTTNDRTKHGTMPGLGTTGAFGPGPDLTPLQTLAGLCGG